MSPPMAAQIQESPTLIEQLEQLEQIQAQLATLTAAIAARNGGNGAGVASSAPTTAVAAVMDGPATAHGRSGDFDSTDVPECLPPTFTATSPTPAPGSGPLKCLTLGNGMELTFSKQEIPDPPSISFARDLPWLMRMWDDESPEWAPSEAVLRIHGEPIALKYWQEVYRYGKSGQWAGMKKNWTHWEDIAMSWQELTEKGFWQRFSVDHQPMSYTAICEVLKEERMADDHYLAERARVEYKDNFEEVFGYRRGGERLVRNKDSAIAKKYRILRGLSPRSRVLPHQFA